MNKVTLTGNVAEDAELKTLESGQSVCNFKIIVINRRRRKTAPLLVSACLYGNEAREKFAKYLTKGRKIKIEGSLNIEEGRARTFVKIYVRKLEFLEEMSDIHYHPFLRPRPWRK